MDVFEMVVLKILKKTPKVCQNRDEKETKFILSKMKELKRTFRTYCHQHFKKDYAKYTMNDLCDRRLSSKMMLILMVVMIMVIKCEGVGVEKEEQIRKNVVKNTTKKQIKEEIENIYI